MVEKCDVLENLFELRWELSRNDVLYYDFDGLAQVFEGIFVNHCDIFIQYILEKYLNEALQVLKTRNQKYTWLKTHYLFLGVG